MGRSVNYLSNAEYVIYFNADWINAEDEDGEYDEYLAQFNWNDFKNDLNASIQAKLKSYYKCERWDNNETRIFLENDLCEIGISEYCGLYSLSIRAKESNYYDEFNREVLGVHHANQVRNSLEKCLIESGADLLNRVGTFSTGVGVFELAKKG